MQDVSPNIVEKTPNREQLEKKKRYWHTTYAESVDAEEIEKWPQKKRKAIRYAGEFTDDEWHKFIRNAPRDVEGEPHIPGEPVEPDDSR